MLYDSYVTTKRRFEPPDSWLRFQSCIARASADRSIKREGPMTKTPTKKPAAAAKKTPRKSGKIRKAESFFQAAIPRSPRLMATPPCRPISRPCRAGKVTSAKGLTSSSRALSRAYTKRSNITRRSTASRAGLVPQPPRLHEIRESGLLPRRVARPVPPGTSKQKDVRYLDIHEDDKLDEKQFAAWVIQASQLPGEKL